MKRLSTNSKILLALILLGGILRCSYYLELKASPVSVYVASHPNFDQYNFLQLSFDLKNNNWIGPKVTSDSVMRYRMATFYPYLVAGSMSLLGQGFYSILLFQILVGIVSIYLMFKAAALLFENERVGLLAAGIWAIYAPIIFYEGAMLRASLIAHLNLLAFFCTLKAVRNLSLRWVLFSGIVIGLSAAMRTNVLIVFIIPYYMWAIKGVWSEKSKVIGIFLLGLFLSIAPFTVRNYLVGHHAIISSQGSDTFWNGNSYDTPGIGLTRTPIQAELSKETQGSALKTLSILFREIKEHPREYQALYWRKFKMFLNGYEIPANLSFDLAKQESFILKLTQLDFRVISPLALLGVLFIGGRARNIGLLGGFLFVLSFSVIMFHIQSRYRMVAIPFYVLMAAWSLYYFYEICKKRQFFQIFTAIAIFVALLLFTTPDQKVIAKYFGGNVRPIDYLNAAAAYEYSYEVQKSNISEAQKQFLLKKAKELRNQSVEKGN